jgi:hypothetical protein
MRCLRAVEQKVDLADRVDRPCRPDPRVAAHDRRRPLARQSRHQPPNEKAILVVEMLSAGGVGHVNDLLRPITQRNGHPQVFGGHGEMLARGPDAPDQAIGAVGICWVRALRDDAGVTTPTDDLTISSIVGGSAG